jgi:flagella basal body P-ring formation protein FlgA
MTSFGRWLFVLLSPLLVAARGMDAPVARGLAARVAQRFAENWNVPVEQVRLSWGHASGEARPALDAPFRLLGQGEQGWYVAVFDPADTNAVAVRVRAGIERPVMVAARPLTAGAKLMPEDLREEVRVHWGTPAHDNALTAAVGWEVRRPLRAGEPLVAPALVAPPLVVAGQPVKFTWESGGVHVSVMGIALNSAREGELVRARLEERPARVTGTVMAPGLASLATGGVR